MPATVLLIDANAEDEQLFREKLALIRGQPFHLQVVRSLARLRPGGGPAADVILLDLHLPDSLGLTTFLRLQPKAGPHPIVVLVGQIDEEVMYYEGTLTDITEAHELSRQLSYEASHDALSWLINRREFEIRLQRALEWMATHRRSPSTI